MNTDTVPVNLDPSKTYAVKGKTLDVICKKVRQITVFNAAQFDVAEDDDKITVTIKASTLACCSAGGGSP